jgi:hypothetical protein
MPDLLNELNDQRRKVDFDTFDITVKELLSMVVEGLVDIAPEYQRQFRWSDARQSTFIESVFLGIPVPSLFMAANSDASWELIDGVQRLSTLAHFVAEPQHLKVIGRPERLRLEGLLKLETFNDMVFTDLPSTVRTQFLLKPLKITTISDKSDLSVRFDLFERLNTGGVSLTEQEIRACLYRGEFNEFIRTLSANKAFRAVVKLKTSDEHNATREDFVLRFFAYLHDYAKFDHIVRDFLNNYMEKASKTFDFTGNRALFEDTFNRLSKLFPQGLKRGSLTPANLFEGVAVGAALALKKSGTLKTAGLSKWVASDDLRQLTSGGTNTNKMVRGRIEFCRDKFLGGD